MIYKLTKKNINEKISPISVFAIQLYQRCLGQIKLTTSVSFLCGSSTSQIISRPGRSQGLLYKQPRHSLINSFSQPFPPTALQRRHAQTVWNSSSSYKTDYVIVIKNFLNHEGHQNRINGPKVTAILLKGWISRIGGASTVEGLRSTGLPRLVYRLKG